MPTKNTGSQMVELRAGGVPPGVTITHESFNRAPERIAGLATLGESTVTQFASGSALPRADLTRSNALPAGNRYQVKSQRQRFLCDCLWGAVKRFVGNDNASRHSVRSRRLNESVTFEFPALEMRNSPTCEWPYHDTPLPSHRSVATLKGKALMHDVCHG